MTTVVDQPASDAGLTRNDYLVMSGEPRPTIGPVPTPPWSMSVNFHLRTDTPVLVCVHEDEDRATVSLGGLTDDLTLFLDADQIDRLVTVLSAARTRLR